VTNLFDAQSIAIGKSHVCALRTGGAMRCWGYNAYRALGDNTNTQRNSPVDVADYTDFDAFGVDAEANHTCALRNQGEARCWGSAYAGCLGEGSGSTTGKVLVKALDDAGQEVTLSNLTSISAMGSHSCAIDSDGLVWCWGRGSDGQLGDGIIGGVTWDPFNVLPLF